MGGVLTIRVFLGFLDFLKLDKTPNHLFTIFSDHCCHVRSSRRMPSSAIIETVMDSHILFYLSVA